MRHANSLRMPPLRSPPSSRRFRHTAASPPGHARAAIMTIAMRVAIFQCIAENRTTA
jgi:hypothetical protein